MQFGSHIYLFTDHWADDQFWVIDEAASLGLRCIDIAIGDDISFDTQTCKQRAEDADIALMISPGAEWPLAADLSADDAEQRAFGIAWHKQQIDLAHELEAVAYTGAIYGHTGVVKKRRPPADEYHYCAEALHEVATYAQQKGIVLALEPMSHFRTHVANTPDQLIKLIQLADHPQLKIAFDTYHAVTEIRDYGESIRRCGDLLWAVQACENDRGVPGGGLVPWPDIGQALQDINFDGFVVLETYNSSIGNFAFERGMFHDPCPDYRDFICSGTDFLRNCLTNNYK